MARETGSRVIMLGTEDLLYQRSLGYSLWGETDMDMNNHSRSRRGPFCLAVRGRVLEKTGKGRLGLNLY